MQIRRTGSAAELPVAPKYEKVVWTMPGGKFRSASHSCVLLPNHSGRAET